MKKIRIIPVGPPSTDADALIDSLGVTKEEKELIYRVVYSVKRGLTRRKKSNVGSGKAVKKGAAKSSQKRSRKSA